MLEDVGGIYAAPTDAVLSRGVPLPAETAVHLDALLDGLPGTIVYRLSLAPDGTRRLLYVSASIEPLTGLRRDDVLRDVSLWYGLIGPEQVERIAAAEAKAMRTMTRFRETVRYDIDGVSRWFEIAARPTALDDGIVLWDGTATEVTDLLAERDERERLAAIVRETDDLVAMVRAEDGAATFLNESWRNLLGMGPDADASTASIATMHPPGLAARYRDVILPRAAHHGTWSGESVILDANGAERPVSQVVIAHPERHDGEDRPVTHYSTIVRDISQRVSMEDKLRQATEHAEIALREVNHRVKNLFALVPALVQLSARGATDVGTLVSAVRDRVAALGRAHALTLNAFSEDRGVALDALIRAVLEPYEERAEAFSIAGPSVRLTARNGNAMSLALHEMATNAVKYGALSVHRGRIALSWTIRREEGASDRLALRWTEADGPPVSEPEGRGGFGTTLIDRLILAQEGTIDREWSPKGLVIEITLPLHAEDRRSSDRGDATATSPPSGAVEANTSNATPATGDRPIPHARMDSAR